MVTKNHSQSNLLYLREIGNHLQQKDRAHHTPQRVKCLVETVFPARGAQLAQEHRWQHAPYLDRDDHLEQVLPVGLNQVPVNDVVVKEGIDMLVDDLFGVAIEPEVLPVADAWHQLNPQ